MLPDDIPVPVRPHHGMCLAYFQGSGYSKGFTGHMQEMLDFFETNVRVKLTVAADEICSACPNNRNGVCRDAGRVEKFDREVLERCGLSENEEMNFRDFAHMVQEKILSPGRRGEICGGCQWEDICSRKKSRWED
ncbi:MAG: DUF1284 domain-containing protein [Eubacteriales bacterium]|nr:DUF1284 domain-containing protein [Eubacteriales bacterium]